MELCTALQVPVALGMVPANKRLPGMKALFDKLQSTACKIRARIADKDETRDPEGATVQEEAALCAFAAHVVRPAPVLATTDLEANCQNTATPVPAPP